MNYIQVLQDTMKKQGSNRFKIIDKGIESMFNTLSIKRILYIGIIFILILLFIPIKVLLASDYRSEDYIKSWRIKEGDTFVIEHTHSVELTKVSEKYIIEGQNIILTESRFNSLGAGLPATTPYKFELTKEGFRIYDINQNMDDLVYRTGAVRANHKLNLNSKSYDFLDFSEPRTGIKFTLDKIPYFIFRIREGLN